MKKNISLSIAILLAIYIVFIQNDPWRHISPDKVYTAIVSTDGCIVPGHSQDFLVNLFKNNESQRIFAKGIRLGMQITMPLTDGTTKNDIIPLSYIVPGKYIGTYIFPDNIEESTATISIFPDRRTDKPIMSCSIPIKKEKAIIVQEPQKQVYIGDKVSFPFASVEKKTGLSIFKIPVRVKVIAPSGYTTTNRVVSTDADGLATFETFIHSASPEGYYTFVFQSDNFEQKISIYAKRNTENLSFFTTQAVYSPDVETNENCGYIFNLNCEPQGALMAYGCPESEHRQIEIWQNGKLQYHSNLALEGGTISLILQKPLLAGCPVLFKVWQISGNTVSSHEKIRYIPPHKSNRSNIFLRDINQEFQNTEKDKLAASFARKGFIGTSSNLTVKNLTKICSQNLKNVSLDSKNETPVSYYDTMLKEDSETQISSQIKFILVEREFSLKDCNKCTILLDTNSFLSEYIKSLNKKEYRLNTILTESLSRVDRYPYLDLQEQLVEKENLEGLLIPISEIYSYISKFPQKKSQYAQSILSTVNKIKNITFIPAELTFDFASIKESELNNLPMLDIEPVARSLESIQGLLKPTGKIILKKNDKITELELNKPSLTISSKDYDSIVNLRSFPLIIEVQ